MMLNERTSCQRSDRYLADLGDSVQAPRWRLLGSGANSEWHVNQVKFFEDAGCKSALIETLPLRGHKGGERYNGRAFGGPSKTTRRDHTAADAFKGTGTWRSSAPCSSVSNDCHIGFNWLADQLGVIDKGVIPKAYATTGLQKWKGITPQCVSLNQSSTGGYLATTVSVQYRSDGGTWQTHTTATNVPGGVSTIRLPVVIVR